MSARDAVSLTPSVYLPPSKLTRHEFHRQNNFHSPYTLPSSVSRKSFACHSYENTGGVGVFFPFWNSLVGWRGFDPGKERFSRSSTGYCQLITNPPSTNAPQHCRGHCHSCLKSFRCNTYVSPRKCCKQKTYGLTKSFKCNTYKKPGGPTTFRFSDVQLRSLHPRRSYGTRVRSDASSVTAIPAIGGVIIRRKLKTNNL